MNEKPCCSPSAGCCAPNRRDLIRFSGLGAAALMSKEVFAGPFEADANAGLGLDPKHPVPVDKKFSAAWLASLTARGKPSTWTDWAALQHIGMPVAGIGTGTVYMGGDGRLWGWDIFNVPHEGAVPNDALKHIAKKSERFGANYVKPPKMESPWNVSHGLVLYVDGKAKRLDHTSFPDVEFTGQYPIGRVALVDPNSPISAVMETYSPFTPLDYDNSSLPVTIIEITLKNASESAADVDLEAYLENAAFRYEPSTNDETLRRVARSLPLAGGAMVMGEIIGAADDSSEGSLSDRPDILLADFEFETWEQTGWVAEGLAFQTGPQTTEGIPSIRKSVGTSFAHSHNTRLAEQRNRDNLTGTLLSPPFKAERRYLSFLIVGGNEPNKLTVELLLGNKVVHSVTGSNSNTFANHTVDLTAWQDKELRLRLTDNAKGAWGSIGIDAVRLIDSDKKPRFNSFRDMGSMAVAVIDDKAKAQARRGFDQATAETPLSQSQEMAVRTKLTIPAKGELKTTVLIAWHFPQVHPEMEQLPDPRRWVAEKFGNAAAVADYTAKNLPNLSKQTHAFRDTWYGSETGDDRGTLPHWLLERSLWTISALTTNGTYRLTQGRVWGWEGTGCCHGTCTHVWHYGQTAGRLFPQFEIDLRERTDFIPAVMSSDGNVGMRGTYQRTPCIDGQAGVLLRCYREHLTDATGGFLKRNWPNIKRAADFLVRAEAEGKVSGNDGVFAQRFQNTLDAKWGGEIPWIVGMYLAGLAAATAMADEMGDKATAVQWRKIIAKGSAAYASYFDTKSGYYKAKCTEDEMLPVHIGPGSHIDMCLGDFWLAQLGLPYIGDKEQLRRSMDSLFKYNFVPDAGDFRKKMEATGARAGRYYAEAGEGGLVMGTWPHGGLPEACKKAVTFKYFQECMSGFEHAAAALMVSLAKDESDPLLTQGLAVCRAIHDRYDASRRNPYNEIECSDHYARAMASYGVFIAATGFYCHASTGLVRFEPKIRAEDFAGPFIGAGAWGRFAQKTSDAGLSASLEVRFGSMRLDRLELSPPSHKAAVSKITLADKELEHRIETRDGRLALVLANPLTLSAGQSLKVSI